MTSLTFIGGVLLGLASSLHCAGMCGGIAASLALSLRPGGSTRARAEVLLAAQAGKTLAYVTAGGALGAVGAAAYGLFNRSVGFFILQRVGAAGLVWVGLSLFGLVPAASLADRAIAPLRRWAWASGRTGAAAPALAGLVWGLLPCGMVYSALLFAMLSGSAFGGAAVMAGFGLGVMPSVTASALGVASLPALAQSRASRAAVGAALIAVGVATLFWPMGGLRALCGL